jgi:hypothetical protein
MSGAWFAVCGCVGLDVYRLFAELLPQLPHAVLEMVECTVFD